MKKHIKLFIITVFILAVALSPGYSQIVVSAGANGYLGNTGIMPGGGLGLEYWFSMKEERARQGIIMGFGLEYISVTTEYTQTKGSGWIFPFSLKYGFLSGKNLNIGIGGGAAMVILDVDTEDYWGDYYISTEIGAAPLAELSLTYLTRSRFNLTVALRGGALFIADGIFPFVGVKLHVGYYIPLS